MRASTWARSTSTSGSSTTRLTLRTRRRALSARGGSATGGWTRPTRRLSLSRGGSFSARRCCCLRVSRRADEKPVLVRVIVVARAVMDHAARVAALDLDRRVADGELPAEPALEVAHDVLRVSERAIAHHNVAAESHLVG